MPRPLGGVDGLREHAMGRAPCARRRGPLDGGADDRVDEAEPARVHGDHPQVLGRREDVETAERRAQRRRGAVGAERRDEQRLAGRGRQRRQPAGVRGLQPRAHRQDRRQTGVTVSFGRAQLLRPLDHGQRVAADRGHERLRHRGGEARPPREGQRIDAAELLERQDADPGPGLVGHAALRPHGDHPDADHDRSAGDERDRLARRRIEPLHVVDTQQQRLACPRGGQEADRRLQHRGRVGHRLLLEGERAAKHPSLGDRERGLVLAQRLEQRGETRPRKLDLALGPGHLDRAHPFGRGAAQQRGLAHPRRAHDRDRPSSARTDAADEVAETREIGDPTEKRGPLHLVGGHGLTLRR